MNERGPASSAQPAVLESRSGARPESRVPALRFVAGGNDLEGPPLTARAAERQLASRLTQLRLPRYRTQDEDSLRGALEPLKAMTGLPIVVAPAAENAVRDRGVVFDLDLPNPISPRNLLNLVTELAGDDVGWTIRNEVVLVTTRERARPALALAQYDVRAATFPLRSFRGPEIGRLAVSGDDPEERFGGVEEDASPRFEADELVTLIQENVAPETWEDPGVSIRAQRGVLLVRQTPAIHGEIRRFLARMGAF
jgi:hypothetical protein